MRRIFPVLAFFLLTFNAGVSQNSGTPDAPPSPRPTRRMGRSDPQLGQRRDDNAETMARMQRERVKQANKERQAKLKSDTDKLLALATELKAYVDKSNENVLSVDVVRKAEEIEKLAHNVKQKMKE